MNFNFSSAWASIQPQIISGGLLVLGAIATYVIGRWLIGLVVGMLRKLLLREKFDPTLSRFLVSATGVALNIFLAVAILGQFGVQTASFAALLAGAGLAIGAAWSGLLANFAAGIFLIILRPFKVGDYITAGGVTGTVDEIGLFVTTIQTPTNIRTFVGNNKILSDNVQNYSASDYIRVELTAQIANEANAEQAMQAIRQRVAQIPNVLAKPEPEIAIHSFSPAGPVLAIRPFCALDYYWQVYFDTNKAISDVLGAAPFPAPMPVYGIKQMSAAAAAGGPAA